MLQQRLGLDLRFDAHLGRHQARMGPIARQTAKSVVKAQTNSSGRNYKTSTTPRIKGIAGVSIENHALERHCQAVSAEVNGQRTK
jgi:hypothetical protein